MREIKRIVIHCADTPKTLDIGVDTIRKWHVEDNGWKDVGYHYVIKRDGTVENGRPIEQIGSHVYGHNKDSIGICLVGGKMVDEATRRDLFTEAQYKSLEDLCIQLQAMIGKHLKFYGHCELDSKKVCPNFDVHEWLIEKQIISEDNNG